MSDRRETLRQYQAIWNGDQPLDPLDKLVTPGFVGHIGSRDRDLSRLKEDIAAYRANAPTVHGTLAHLSVLSSGDFGPTNGRVAASSEAVKGSNY